MSRPCQADKPDNLTGVNGKMLDLYTACFPVAHVQNNVAKRTYRLNFLFACILTTCPLEHVVNQLRLARIFSLKRCNVSAIAQNGNTIA